MSAAEDRRNLASAAAATALNLSTHQLDEYLKQSQNRWQQKANRIFDQQELNRLGPLIDLPWPPFSRETDPDPELGPCVPLVSNHNGE